MLLYRYQSLAYEGNTWLTVFIFENDLKVFNTTINSSIMALQKKNQETEETYVRVAVDHELQFKTHHYIALLKLFHSGDYFVRSRFSSYKIQAIKSFVLACSSIQYLLAVSYDIS